MEWLKDFGVVDFGYFEDSIPASKENFTSWIKKDHHLPLSYLGDERFSKRLDLKNYWSEFESALVFLFSYNDSHRILDDLYQNNSDWNGLKIAPYTLGFEGMDYHHELRNRLMSIGERLKETYKLEYKITLDTHPVLERDMAFKAGLGWFGKNSMLIHRKEGSFLLIGSLLLNKKIKINLKKIESDHCGQCTLCVQHCPTNAIDAETRTIIAKDCISTFTIEQFKLETIPSEKMDLSSGFIFGCDICQVVCPWNNRIERMKSELNHKIELKNKALFLAEFFLLRPIHEIHEKITKMSLSQFKNTFAGTSFERSGKRGILKNLNFYLKNKL